MKRDELDFLIKNGFLNSKPDRSLTEKELSSLTKQGFLEELPNNYFAFNNNLTWEVIYETLLYSERRILHNLIALHIEKHNQDKLNSTADLLLYHFDRALAYEKCVYYSALAGDHASSMYAISDAITYYKKSVDYLDILKSNEIVDYSLAHEHIADIYELSGEYDEAIKYYTAALHIWKKLRAKKPKVKFTPWQIKPSTQEALLCRKLAMTHEHKCEYEKSFTWLDEAENKLPNRPGIVYSQICSTRSSTLYRVSSHLDAITWGKKALNKAKQLKANSEIAYACNILVNPYIVVGSFDKAIIHLKEANEIYKDQNDLQGLAITNYNLGRCLANTGNLKEAKSYFEIVLEIDEKLHNKATLAMDNFNLGNIALMEYQFDCAIKHLNEVIRLHDSGLCSPDVASIAFIYLGKANIISNKLSIAEDYISKGINIMASLGESSYLDHAYITLADLYNAKKVYIKAKATCEDTLKKAEKSKNKILEIECFRALGTAFAGLGEIGDSLETLEKSIELAQSMGLKNHEANSIYEKVKVLHENNIANEEDIASLKHAINIFQETGAAYDLEQAKKLLSSL